MIDTNPVQVENEQQECCGSGVSCAAYAVGTYFWMKIASGIIGTILAIVIIIVIVNSI